VEKSMKPIPSPEICADCDAYPTRECLSKETVRLSSYKPGERGTVVQVCGRPETRLRLMEMGFVRGAEVRTVKDAPLNDPVEYVIKGYHVSLRRVEASDILMNPPANGNGRPRGGA
jgi:Fe2+ transport system protein FeoA